jgi:hypothetical protein
MGQLQQNLRQRHANGNLHSYNASTEWWLIMPGNKWIYKKSGV